MARCFWLILICTCWPAAFAAADSAVDSQNFLGSVRVDLQTGVIDLETALLEQFHYVFDRDLLAPRYQGLSETPLRCITSLINEYQRLKPRLSVETRSVIDAYLARRPNRAVHDPPGGHVRLLFSTTGPDAVPTADVAPADGVPDYVQKIGAYFETSWQIEFAELGFMTPVVQDGRLEVSFLDMAAYGYTSVVDAGQGLTRIVMNNTFEGFPWNDDPEGDVWGAAKVTAAHELKHASQYRGSGWSEGEWIELDAVWVEEMVFDQVNDYYNYLLGESPLVRPEVSLAGPDGAGGSYEDCVFQHWLGQVWGVDIVTDFWTWRETHTDQSVVASWQHQLAQRDVDWHEAWAEFTAWNYGTGFRAVPGLGYEEAPAYPHGLATVTAHAYPFVRTSEIDYLAAEFINLYELGGQPGRVRIEFEGGPGGVWTLAAHVRRTDGTGVIETLAVPGDGVADWLLEEPLQDVAYLGLMVGNAAATAGTAAYSLQIDREANQPEPMVMVEPGQLQLTLGMEQSSQQTLVVGNQGEPGSMLDFTVRLQDHPLVDADVKSVAGTTLVVDQDSYLPGRTATLVLTVANGSSDDEWLTDVTLSLPGVVTVLEFSDFVGGSLGDLTGSLDRGSGPHLDTGWSIISWHGTYGSQGYGLIRDGETATAMVTVSFAPEAGGTLALPWSVVGDAFGASPHTVSGQLELEEGAPAITVWSPAAGRAVAIGGMLTVTWTTEGESDVVDVLLSRDGGDSWDYLAAQIPDSGQLLVPADGPASDDCRVRVAAAGGTADSPGEFSIYAPLDWATCVIAAGQITQGGQQILPLLCSSHGLAAGTHVGYCVVDHNGPESPLVVPLTLVVDPLSPVPTADAAIRLLANVPNPFNPITRIRLQLPAALDVEVDILDLRGRLLRRLHAGVLPAGDQSLDWDGRDGQGRALASGAYLVRARCGTFSTTRKMMLAR